MRFSGWIRSRQKGQMCGVEEERPKKLILFFIILLAFFLQTFMLGGKELSYDEVASLYIVSRGTLQMFSFLFGATFDHPPLYYLLLQLWIKLCGQGEFVFRFLSVIFGVLCIPLVFRLGSRLVAPEVGIIASALLALSAFQVYYAQDARMYSLVCFLALLSLNSFEVILRQEGRKAWLLYGVSTVLLISTHYYGALVVLFQDLFLLIFWRSYRSVAKKPLLAQVALAVVAAGWAVSASGFRESVGVVAGYGQRPLGERLSFLRLLVSEFTVGRRLRLDLAWRLSLGVVPLGLLGAWALGRFARREGSKGSRIRHRQAFLLLYLLIPVLAAGQLPYPLAPRLLTPVLPAYISILASGIAWALWGAGWLRSFAKGLARGLLFGYLAFVLAVFGYGLSFYFGQYVKEEYRGAVEEITRNSQPGDAIILDGPWQELLFNYYYQRDIPHFTVPPYVPPPLDPVKAEATLRELATRFARIWLVLSATDKADPGAYVERWLRGNAREIYSRGFADARVILYELPDGDIQFTEGLKPEPGGFLRLAGLGVESWALEAGDIMRLELLWEALAAMQEDYKLSIRLVDREGLVWLETEFPLQAGENYTSHWEVGQRAISHLALHIPPGLPPGQYNLLTVVYSPSSLRALAVDGSKGTGGGKIVLGSVSIRGKSTLVPEGVYLPGADGVTFGGEVELLGGRGLPREAWQGDSVKLLVHWRALRGIGRELSLWVELVGGDGRVLADWRRPLAAGWYGTSQWGQGEVVMGQHILQLSSELPGGDYQVRLSVHDSATGQRLPVQGLREGKVLGHLWRRSRPFAGENFTLSQLRVKERERRWEVPSIQHPSVYRLGDRIELLGHSIVSRQVKPGGMVSLTLYWRAKSIPSESYKVFTHVLDENEVICGQKDAIPLGGARPTTSWLEGEVLIDEYLIPIREGAPPGHYRVAVGMYDPQTAARLEVWDARGNRIAENRILLDVSIQVVGDDG